MNQLHYFLSHISCMTAGHTVVYNELTLVYSSSCSCINVYGIMFVIKMSVIVITQL